MSKQISAMKGASTASRAEQANESAVRVNQQVDERMPQYSMRRSIVVLPSVERPRVRKRKKAFSYEAVWLSFVAAELSLILSP